MNEIFENPAPYSVYVQIDTQGRITAVNSSAFVPEDWGTEIDSGYGDKYHHAQGNYFPQPLYTEDGIPRYKLQDGQAVERTEAEISADRAAQPEPEPTPTLEERVSAVETGKAEQSDVVELNEALNMILTGVTE